MRVAIVGLGLIGGSLALATGAKGYDADPRVRARARDRGLDVADDLAAAVSGAELIVSAVPGPALGVLREIVDAAPDAVLTDTASLKRPLAAVVASLPEGARVVGGHPMAGSTGTGIEAADPALFHGRRWLIVPTARSDPEAAAMVGELARSVGAEPVVLGAERHDVLMTWVSHLPLVVAAALAKVVVASGEEGVDAVAGPGLLDTTRLAATPEVLALELLRADRQALALAIEEVSSDLAGLVDLIGSGEVAHLAAYLAEARRARAQLERTRDSSSEK